MWFTLFIVISYRNLKCAQCDSWIIRANRAINVGAADVLFPLKNLFRKNSASFPEMCSKFNLFRRFLNIRFRF